MKFSELLSEPFDLFSPNKRVVVIGEDAPGIYGFAVLLEQLKQASFAFCHPFGVFPDGWGVFIAGCGYQILAKPC